MEDQLSYLCMSNEVEEHLALLGSGAFYTCAQLVVFTTTCLSHSPEGRGMLRQFGLLGCLTEV